VKYVYVHEKKKTRKTNSSSFFFISIFVFLSNFRQEKNFVLIRNKEKKMWATGATHMITRLTGSTLFIK